MNSNAPSCRVLKWLTTSACDISQWLSMNANTVIQSWRVRFSQADFSSDFADVFGVSWDCFACFGGQL